MADASARGAFLPTVLTPRSHTLKRRHSEIVDLTADEHGLTPPRSAHKTDDGLVGIEDLPPARKRKLDEDDDDSEDNSSSQGSYVQDYLDTLDVEPYQPNGGHLDLAKVDTTRLHAELRKIGPNLFVDRYLVSKHMPPRMLGTAFGMDPGLSCDDDIFQIFLVAAINRAYKKRQKLSKYNTIDDAARLLRTRQRIMVITGAGISTSLGIPDFRSKGTGFYDKLRDLGFNEAEEVFDIHAFDSDPSVFYSLAGDILPDLKRYSPTHAFIRLLQDKGHLQTNYTQNIDNLEELAGIDRARLIQCHGSFATASCRKCKHQIPGRDIFADIRAKRIAKCKQCIADLSRQSKAVPAPKAKKKSGKFKLKKNDWDSSSEDEDDNVPEPGVMKPDITFFGEQLPTTFFNRFTESDCKTVDLVVVIGTSLKVAPVSEMPNYLPAEIPHIFISREPIEHVNFDIQVLGDCDHVVHELCRRAGWNLRHEMIPRGFEVKVAPVEGSTYRWTVAPASMVEAESQKTKTKPQLPASKKVAEARPQVPTNQDLDAKPQAPKPIKSDARPQLSSGMRSDAKAQQSANARKPTNGMRRS